VVAEVEDDRALPLLDVAGEALPGAPVLGRGVVPLLGVEVHLEPVAYLADDALQRLLLDPDLRPERLVGPLVDAVARRTRSIASAGEV
jgi:hypothetical protein